MSYLPGDEPIQTDDQARDVERRLEAMRALKPPLGGENAWVKKQSELRRRIMDWRESQRVAKPFPTSDGKETERNIARTAMQEKLHDAQERLMRLIDEMTKESMAADDNYSAKLYGPREIAIVRTKLREAFMWADEACFPAQRRTLAED